VSDAEDTVSAPSLHKEAHRLLAAGDLQRAAQACESLNAAHPGYAPGWATGSSIALRLGDPQEALRRADVAASLAASDPAILIQRAHCLFALRRTPEALHVAESARSLAGGNPAVLDAVGTLFSMANEEARALACYDEAVARAPANPAYSFNRATVKRFLGDLTGAEQDYDRVIALEPRDYEAYFNRADLRRQTTDRNHIPALEALLAAGIPDWRGEVQSRFALAKELEDVGRFAESFAQLQSGSGLRRRHLRYDVAVDAATADWIIDAFPHPPVAAISGCESREPIFIVGLPRSGTTLVDRILESHSQVRSAGELDCFAQAIVAACRGIAGKSNLPREQLVKLSGSIDFPALGREYLEQARPRAASKPHFTDKMPLNYLYCGLIRRALPNARIIHVTRRPMAACYAIYKTLFKAGYPYSYDFDDLVRYYAAYRKLMAHWQSAMPAHLYELSYEDLVADQIGESRRLLAFCNLEWEEACAEFHRNPSASKTASASQIRRPIYRSSVSQWRNYQAELEPLRRALTAAGIPDVELPLDPGDHTQGFRV
jgi:tetratricopeptide (TPR) repeat protein